jgi:drug/metabolite transporter (DMT)-like permease
VLAAAAYGLQALALAFGPLALVAPVVATNLLFALPLAAWASRRPLRSRNWVGCALVADGVGICRMPHSVGVDRPAHIHYPPGSSMTNTQPPKRVTPGSAAACPRAGRPVG